MVDKGSISIERRKFLRLPASVHLKFRKISNGNVVSHKTLTKDIAVAGIRFLSHEFMPVSTYLKVKLTCIENTEPIEFICRVVWIKSIFNAESYEIGAAIWQIDKRSYKQIKSYIYR